MYSIVRTIALEVGVELGELSAFYVAGTFGLYIDPRSAITIGMLPDLPLETFQALGNTALEGATLVLRDPASVAEVDRLVMAAQIGLEIRPPALSGAVADLRRALRPLPAAAGPMGEALELALGRCAAARSTCPRVLPALARYRAAAMSNLRPVRTRQRFAGWLELSALLLCLLVPLMGVLQRQR